MALTEDVIILRIAPFFVLKLIERKSMATWPPLLSSQAAPRKVINNRRNSLTSVTQTMDRSKKYLSITSQDIDKAIKARRRQARRARKDNKRSKPADSFSKNFITHPISALLY
jgi:hypothetical protein